MQRDTILVRKTVIAILFAVIALGGFHLVIASAKPANKEKKGCDRYILATPKVVGAGETEHDLPPRRTSKLASTSNRTPLLISKTALTSMPCGYLHGNLVTDTTLVAGCTYVITDDLGIPGDITLIIEPGVKMLFEESRLQVAGTIKAEGSALQPVIFTTSMPQRHSGWPGIEFIYGSPPNTDSLFDHCTIEYARHAMLLNEVDNIPTIKNTTFQHNGYCVYSHGARTPLIISVYGSRFVDNGTALSPRLGDSGILSVTHSTIANNGIGVDGYYATGEIQLNYNNIFGNAINAKGVIGYDAIDIDASHNWWGTTDENQIEETIYDCDDDLERGCVLYKPVAASAIEAAPYAYRLDINTIGKGSVTKEPYQDGYNIHDVVTLTATADLGWTFEAWSGNVVTNMNPLSLTMDSNRALTATFGQKTFNITPTTEVGGVIAPGTPQTVNYGDAITFTIDADTGYHIVDVIVDGISQGAIDSHTFENVTADHVIGAEFALNVSPKFTSPDHTTFMVSEAGTFTVTASGVPIPSIDVDGRLPVNVSFTDNGDGTATLSGTPTSDSRGIYRLTLTATNRVTPDATQSFSLVVGNEVYLPLLLAKY